MVGLMAIAGTNSAVPFVQNQSTQTTVSPHFWLALTCFLTIQLMDKHLQANGSTSW
jgi:hypothetical protein